MSKHYTVTKEGSSKIYENDNVRIRIYPKHQQYFEPVATVKVGSFVWSSANISRTDAANMIQKIREASRS